MNKQKIKLETTKAWKTYLGKFLTKYVQDLYNENVNEKNFKRCK